MFSVFPQPLREPTVRWSLAIVSRFWGRYRLEHVAQFDAERHGADVVSAGCGAHPSVQMSAEYWDFGLTPEWTGCLPAGCCATSTRLHNDAW